MFREVAKAKEGQSKDYPQGIPECGTDALRFALIASAGQGRDINLDVLRVHGYRCFCNKIWQGARFIFMQLGTDYKPAEKFTVPQGLFANDKWILSRLAYCIEQCDQGFKSYQFQLVTTATYSFWLYDLCDIYLESIKPDMAKGEPKTVENIRAVLYLVLDSFLRLISPFMPFITEELWQRLPKRSANPPASICIAQYPEPEHHQFRDEPLEKTLALVMEIVGKVRSLRTDKNVLNKVKLEVSVIAPEKDLPSMKTFKALISTLANLKQLEFGTTLKSIKNIAQYEKAEATEEIALFINWTAR